MRPLALVVLAAVSASLAACGGSDGVTRFPVPVAGSPVRGPADAWVTVVEYGDYQCPACRSDAPRVAAVVAAYPDDVRFVFKQFPLGYHEHARPAALAAVCAGAQGAFWAMHDQLYASGADLSDASLEAYAQGAGLDLPAWRTCLASTAASAQVDADLAEGVRFELHGTPTYYVNGVKHEGTATVTPAVIEAARAEAVASGVARAEYYDRVVLGR